MLSVNPLDVNSTPSFWGSRICPIPGIPIPSFVGEPERVSIGNEIDMFADILWDQLNIENKISLFVRYTDLQSGEYEQRIFNKNE